MKNQVIEVLNIEHGEKVIEYWKLRGVDTSHLCGNITKKYGGKHRYYGVIECCFNCYSIEVVHKHNAEIIELPKEEKPFPRVMLVSFDGDTWKRRVVFMKKCNRFLAWNDAETVEESEDICSVTGWRYSKELPEKVELTKSEIAEKFGISVDQLVIKND